VGTPHLRVPAGDQHSGNGYLLVARWLDARYLHDLAERTALSLTLSQPKPSDNVLFFKPLKPQMSYRLVDLGLTRVRGEGLGDPMLILRVGSSACAARLPSTGLGVRRCRSR
jgi:hypothetical protein